MSKRDYPARKGQRTLQDALAQGTIGTGMGIIINSDDIPRQEAVLTLEAKKNFEKAKEVVAQTPWVPEPKATMVCAKMSESSWGVLLVASAMAPDMDLQVMRSLTVMTAPLIPSLEDAKAFARMLSRLLNMPLYPFELDLTKV